MKNIKRKSIIAVGVTALSALALGVGAIALNNADKNTGLDNNGGFLGSYNLTAYAEESDKASASKITVAGKEVDITSTATFTSTDEEKTYTLCLTVIDTEDLKEVTSQLVVGHKIGGTYYNGTEAGLTKYVYSSITFADETTLVASELSLGSSFTTPCFIVAEVLTTVVDGNTPESIITYAGSQGLAMTLNGDSTAYTVSGIGTCTETEIVIPLSYEGLPVTAIAANAFDGNTAITGVTIPASVTSIGINSFASCSALTSVIMDEGVSIIGTGMFNKCSSLSSITIPDSVTSIGASAFENCKSLESVTIGNGVKTISNYAFKYCSGLKSIVIPKSVTSIGQSAFNESSNITSVYITDIVAWCKISFGNDKANPLYYAGNLYLNGDLVTELTIPDGVTSIGKYAFYNYTSLTSVTIPASVTSIGTDAFNGCTNLTTVYYNGTADEWGAISIGDNNTPLTSENVYYYSAEEPTTEGKFWHYADGVPTVWVKEDV